MIYLVQTLYPDGNCGAEIKHSQEIITMFGMRDCTDCEHEVYDISDYGNVVKLEHWPAISAPFNYHRFVNPENGEVVFEGYSPEH